MPNLYKITEDGRQFKDGGARVEIIEWNEDGTHKETHKDGVLRVGCSVLVGSVTARSYSRQDYWLTTPVTEILEVRKDADGLFEYARFRTHNSEYELVS